MSWYRRITRLRITNPTSAQPASHHHSTATILAERMRGVLLECSSMMHGASVLPADMGYQLCTQTLGSISTSLTEVLGQTGYGYLISTPPAHDETIQTSRGGTRGRRQRGSSSTGSSRGRSRGLGCSISRG
ncbi:uncharacterized protein LOC130809349 isoform X2 [Amaranthus tricolor]|nr:uncharacterized protein LOC130809349 isoform X2 [Amaranthus tricolor]XP_057531064.1 uncharacterized protein LOC130809349 isoform X2 [Amaranthus tricolor]